jgi:hypothetical protein
MKKGTYESNMDTGERNTVALDFPITQAQVQGFDPTDGTIYIAGMFAIPAGLLKAFEGYASKLKILGPNGEPPAPPLEEILVGPPLVRMMVQGDALTPQANAEVVNRYLQNRAVEGLEEE